jgi:hypothetical protein
MNPRPLSKEMEGEEVEEEEDGEEDEEEEEREEEAVVVADERFAQVMSVPSINLRGDFTLSVPGTNTWSSRLLSMEGVCVFGPAAAVSLPLHQNLLYRACLSHSLILSRMALFSMQRGSARENEDGTMGLVEVPGRGEVEAEEEEMSDDECVI